MDFMWQKIIIRTNIFCCCWPSFFHYPFAIWILTCTVQTSTAYKLKTYTQKQLSEKKEKSTHTCTENSIIFFNSDFKLCINFNKKKKKSRKIHTLSSTAYSIFAGCLVSFFLPFALLISLQYRFNL